MSAAKVVAKVALSAVALNCGTEGLQMQPQLETYVNNLYGKVEKKLQEDNINKVAELLKKYKLTKLPKDWETAKQLKILQRYERRQVQRHFDKCFCARNMVRYASQIEVKYGYSDSKEEKKFIEEKNEELKDLFEEASNIKPLSYDNMWKLVDNWVWRVSGEDVDPAGKIRKLHAICRELQVKRDELKKKYDDAKAKSEKRTKEWQEKEAARRINVRQVQSHEHELQQLRKKLAQRREQRQKRREELRKARNNGENAEHNSWRKTMLAEEKARFAKRCADRKQPSEEKKIAYNKWHKRMRAEMKSRHAKNN